VFEVVGGGEAALAELVNVEGELSLNMGALALREVDDGAVFFFELGKLDGDGMVDGGAMSDGVADVVREGADGEGEFVGRLSIRRRARTKSPERT
jgi:hypothetical protein